MNFKYKCIDKMKELNSDGTTILFVSHEEKLIKNLCNYGIYFKKGKTSKKKEINECISEYKDQKAL